MHRHISFSSHREYRFYQGPVASCVANGIQAVNFLGDRFLRRYRSPAGIEELYAQLAEAGNIQNMLPLLNNFFIQQAVKNTLPGNCFVSAALQLIIKSKGLISSNQLVKLTGYTERHIERKFNEYVGTTPKRFSNIVRLHVFLKELKAKGNSRNLTQIAYEAGYADQSHLIKEFKKITGMSPAIYQHNTDKLASNFVNLRIGAER